MGNDFTQDPPENGIPMDSPPPNGFPMDPLTGVCSSFDSLRRSLDPDGLFNDTLPGNNFTQELPPAVPSAKDGMLGGESLLHSWMVFPTSTSNGEIELWVTFW
jgi:hypothetical protein